MKHLAKLAQLHGFKTALFSTFVMVWDDNGCTYATNTSELKQWMGY